ncbi:MAG: hypothetical protein LBC61_07505 [Candidatus Peribacteria bacterium]|nr:hypothetical protein [Candidatus Peribacteria bacterium]
MLVCLQIFSICVCSLSVYTFTILDRAVLANVKIIQIVNIIKNNGGKEYNIIQPIRINLTTKIEINLQSFSNKEI